MRVTNSMISNSSRIHISNAKNKLLTAEEQYTTEKKIQRPSEDPTVASRSLKFRTTLSQLKQYTEKNVQDAMDWMDTTESALSNIDSTLSDMKKSLDYGANSYLEAKERTSILAQLQQYANAIFEDEANADYSGRYLFTGYRTDTSLIFPTANDSLEYQIKENFSYTDIDAVRNVTSEIKYDENATADDYAKMEAKINNCYRLQLAYDNLSNSAIQGGNTVINIDLSYKAANGTTVTDTLNVGTVSADDINAYDIEAYNKANGTNYDALYIYENGHVVLSEDTYNDIQKNEANISVDYCKKSFEKSDIRPEMYFECSRYDTVSMKTVEFAEPSDQKINYEVNFSQTITVNTQARDAISTDIYRAMDAIALAIQDVDDVENRIAEIEKMISNSDDDDEKETLSTLLESLESEKSLRVSIMNEAFGMGLTMVDETQQLVSVANSELGAKYNRLQLTYDKLLDEGADTEEKLSNNEDVDIADAIINLTQADNLYQASLSATSKILGNTLLDYL